VLKPASPTPWSILSSPSCSDGIVPKGVINVVTGPGAEIGKALATSPRIAKIGFTGETTTGRLIMQYAAQNLIPSTVELGGKSPNIFFADVMNADDEFLDKAIEGLVLLCLQQGRSLHLPVKSTHSGVDLRQVHGTLLGPHRQDHPGNPLDTSTMIGAQVSNQQLEKIESYVEIGKQEGAQVLIGATLRRWMRRWRRVLLRANGDEGSHKMRVFQEEIFGPFSR